MGTRDDFGTFCLSLDLSVLIDGVGAMSGIAKNDGKYYETTEEQKCEEDLQDMKTKLFQCLSIFFTAWVLGTGTIQAQSPSFVSIATPSGTPALQSESALPPEGAWIIDPEVTRIGKNASRSGQLLDWTLRDYQWASTSAQQLNNSPLASFWLVIQRIVYALFFVVILITAFVLIVTRGRSLSAKRFLPRFFLAVVLVTFSFSLIQFIYQLTDIIQGFFLKNTQGEIISSKDLLYIGFNYPEFQGLRRFGLRFEESAFMSLILVKFTAFTYYVMALLLIFRKILLWFFIVLSPLFPILLLFYPLRNTAKIWIGEFFRWVLYAPLFAIFLSGLVKLWNAGLPLVFNFSGVAEGESVYPTAVNILLGGPGQRIGINNSVNLPDTFALYVVALIMLWAVILLPFILLQIFLDHMLAFNYQQSPVVKQLLALMNNRLIPPPKPLIPQNPVGPTSSSGIARNVPYARRFELPRRSTSGLAREISTSLLQQQSVTRPVTTSISNETVVRNLTSLSIPTMRDIARFETTKLAKDSKAIREIFRVQQILRQIANPLSTSSKTDRDRMQLVRERLRIEGQRGNPVANHILTAATTYNTYYSQRNVISQVNSSLRQLIENLAYPQRLTEVTERKKITQLKEELTQAAKNGNTLAQTVLTIINNSVDTKNSQLTQLIHNLAHPETVSNVTERQTYTTLREKLVNASKSGNLLATLVLNSLEKAISKEEVKKIQDELIQAQASGNPLASEILKVIEQRVQITDKDIEEMQTKIQEASKHGEPLAVVLLQLLEKEKTKSQATSPLATAKLKAGVFPVVNRIQQVSLDDYEAVRKMWKENYQTLDVPESSEGQQTRKDWIVHDISDIEETINLLSSSNPEEIQQGMQKVSDILPFLLIGGFSQTEIIAYLKAKMEAGKSVLEDISKEEKEEETFQTADYKARTATSQAMAEEIPDTTQEAEAPSTIMTIQNGSMHTTINNDSQIQARFVGTPAKNSSITNSNHLSLLELTHLPVLTMKDIVRFETARQKESTNDRLEREKIQQTLTKIAYPESLSDTSEKEKFIRIREELIKEHKNGNPLASLILNATVQSVTPPLSPTQEFHLPFIANLLMLIKPDLARDTVRDDYRVLNKSFLVARGKSDSIALALLRLFDQITSFLEESTQDFLQKISDPSHLATASEQMHYSKLVDRIAQSSEKGNQVAGTILKLARQKCTPDTAQKLFSVITTASQNGDTLATYIASILYALPQELEASIKNTYLMLTQAKAHENELASAFLRLLNRQFQEHTGVSREMVGQLPRQNRVQQVTLEDYETVKKLWIENYRSIEPPQRSQDKKLSRSDWIYQDIASISETINLLSSDNPQVVQEGMEKVGDLLPFLLLGGFSQSEIIGYLKAKLEAGKTVLQELNTAVSEDETVLENRKTVVSPKQNQIATDFHTRFSVSQDIQPPTPVPRQVASVIEATPSPTASEFRFPLPTIKDIALFEQKHDDASYPRVAQLKRLLSNLSNPENITSPKDRDQVRALKQALDRQSQKGYATISSILASLQQSAETLSRDNPQEVLLTLTSVLDPSLIQDIKTRKEYIAVREELVRARATGNATAVNLVKVVDTASEELTKSTIKLLQLLTRNGQQDDPVKSKELREVLESAKEDKIAQILLASSQSITPVIANKVREQLIEAAAAGNRLAKEVITNYLPLPQSVVTQITTLYQQLTENKEKDLFADKLLRLLKKENLAGSTRLCIVQLPKQNKMQKVSLDDYEAVKQMFYEMYLYAQVPLDAKGEVQQREQWITTDKEQIVEVINLLSSDVPENVSQGLAMVGDILPFLLIGGFTKDEILQYLKAKKIASEMALKTLQGSVASSEELVSAVVRKRPKVAKKLEEQEFSDEKGDK